MCAQEEYNIPDDLIIHFNHTLLAYICVITTPWNLKEQQVFQLLEKEKKKKQKQIAVPFKGTETGLFLPMQLIYKGKTTHSLLK